jgi:hypothetical protein
VLRCLLAALVVCSFPESAGAADPACSPGWNGTPLIGCDSLARWTVERDTGASGSLRLAPGIVGGQSVELDWDLGSGDWVQARYDFPAPVDLSRAEILGLSLQGGGPAELPNTVGILVADVNDVFHGYDMGGQSRGLNQVDRALLNLPVPKKLLRFFFAFGAQTVIDWTRIDRFFIVVKRPGTGAGGGSGSIKIDHVQQDAASLWPRQALFEVAAPQEEAARRAAAYIQGQQMSTGLIVSWKEEPSARAYLYDQALGLLVLSREGAWAGGTPENNAALAGTRLADFLSGAQKQDGHWARCWDPKTGSELVDDEWVGDQAWCVLALSEHSKKSGRAAAMESARKGAAWLASRIDALGKVTASTEGNVDAWWAMVATCRLEDAAKIQAYLLRADTVWDSELEYWWRGREDPVIAMDAATWLSAFARHPLVGEPERGLSALSFVRRTLVTASDDGTLCGFDGMGPVSVWNEGTAQYVAAGGQDSERFLAALTAQQRPDGAMPGSPDAWSTDSFGWLSPWSGLAPTAWLYFAITGLPFPMEGSFLRGDATGDGFLDISDPVAILMFLFLGGPIQSNCGKAVADANEDGAVDIGDPIYLLGFLFLGGPRPGPPVPACECLGRFPQP